MLKKGFTLIELLIVITIIAILAGAAIPYVQDYVEDARISKAKDDLNVIKQALIRFELDRGVSYNDTDISTLVGPYMDKAIADPWGTPYEVDEPSSKVISWGPNRIDEGALGDDITVDFRPPLALSKAYWIDTDKSGSVTNNDQIKLKFTRPFNASELDALDGPNDWDVIVNGTSHNFTTIDTSSLAGAKDAVILLSDVTGGTFIAGRDTLNYHGGTNNLHDRAVAPLTPETCSQNLVVIQPL